MTRLRFRRTGPPATVWWLAVVTAVWGLTDAGPLVAAGTRQGFPQGDVIERVVCLTRPDHSYALYMPAPTAAAPAGKRPVLYLLDPGARGALAVARFRSAADELGWILVGSNNSRNGPWDANLEAARILWDDTRARLPIDESRIYAGGFSGGARAASVFPLVLQRRLAGLIGVGAGLAVEVPARDLLAAAFVGVVGLADFNYAEVRRLDTALDATALPHRVFVTDAPHQWPDADTCRRTLRWLEVTAARQGLAAGNGAWLDRVFSDELAHAASAAAMGRPYWAALDYANLAVLFAGLRDTTPAEREHRRLEATAEYRTFLRTETQRDRRQAAFEDAAAHAHAEIEWSGGDRSLIAAMVRQLDLDALKADAVRARTPEDRGLAARLLALFGVTTEQRAEQHAAGRRWRLARAYLELAIHARLDTDPRLGSLHYNLACLAARDGDTAGALRALEAAVDRGFSSVDTMAAERALERVRTLPRYTALVARIKRAGR